jgi:hypothetical protein
MYTLMNNTHTCTGLAYFIMYRVNKANPLYTSICSQFKHLSLTNLFIQKLLINVQWRYLSFKATTISKQKCP